MHYRNPCTGADLYHMIQFKKMTRTCNYPMIKPVSMALYRWELTVKETSVIMIIYIYS